MPSTPDKETRDWTKLFRPLWWVATLLFSLYLIFTRFGSVSSDKPTSLDTALLALTAILILLPFISEVSAFGFTVKKQIEEAKKELKQDVKDEIQPIRNELLALSISNRLTSNVILQTGIPNPPPDNALDDIKNQITQILEQFQQQRGPGEVQAQHSEVSPNTVHAFEQRYLVEKELKRIWSIRVKNGDFYRYPPFSRMVDDLVQYQLIAPNFGGSLKEVYAVASAAIHGDEPSQEKINFLRDVTPEIIATLSSIR